MAADALHYWIMVLDIENFSGRDDPVQRSVRRVMYEVLRGALKEARLASSGIVCEDRGDGVLMLAPPTVPPVRLAGALVRGLNDELAQRAPFFSAAHRMRFRIALHQGLADRDPQGWSGEAVNTACRLVDAQPLREVLTAAERAQLVFIVSDEVYRAVIRHGHRSIDPAAYLPVTFRTKHGESITGWVTVPGYSAPPGLPATDMPPDATAPAQAPTAPPLAGPGPVGGVTLIAGVVHGGQIAGDKITYQNSPGQVRP